MIGLIELNLELDATEKEARDILKNEGIDPDKIGRHFFGGWPETKIHFVDIGYINSKLSDFNEAAHYAYSLLGFVILTREMINNCKDEEELRRMVYSINLGKFFILANVGLNIPEARKFFKREASSMGGKGKRGAEGPVKQTVRRILKEIEKDKLKPTFKNVIDKMIDPDFMADLYETLKNPIPLSIRGVYRSNGDSIHSEDKDYDLKNYFEYHLRTNPKKKEPLKFRRINDTLNEILKK
ncbi:MAG: hypothetical protein IT393_10695 [Nitrospirae bacterium]|nr:hypothetical protein [Nitrospirota bacterium]